jgi:hypothetical protein
VRDARCGKFGRSKPLFRPENPVAPGDPLWQRLPARNPPALNARRVASHNQEVRKVHEP